MDLTPHIGELVVFVLTVASAMIVRWLDRRSTNAAIQKTDKDAREASSNAVKNMQQTMEEMTRNYQQVSSDYVKALKRITEVEKIVMARDGRISALEKSLEEVQDQLAVEQKERERFQKGVDILIRQLIGANIEPDWRP